MKNRNVKRKLRKMVFKELDLIYKSCKNTAGKWDKKAIPLAYLNNIIKIIKDQKNKVDDKSLNEFISQYKILLTNLYNTATEISKMYNSKDISIDTLKMLIDTIKTNFEFGLNE